MQIVLAQKRGFAWGSVVYIAVSHRSAVNNVFASLRMVAPAVRKGRCGLTVVVELSYPSRSDGAAVVALFNHLVNLFGGRSDVRYELDSDLDELTMRFVVGSSVGESPADIVNPSYRYLRDVLRAAVTTGEEYRVVCTSAEHMTKVRTDFAALQKENVNQYTLINETAAG